MEYFRIALGILIAIAFFVIITRIFMMVAAHIGKTFGFGECIVSFFEKKSNK